MWLIHARPRALGRLVPSVQVRHSSVREVLGFANLHAEGDVAKRLQDTKVWRPHRTKAARPKVPGEKTRVNITSEKLCDDIEKYFGSSLQRHEGCDLVDLFPGAGVWSTKLHDMVRPRRHILMEPDALLYAPFLENLTSKPGTTLIAKSGLVWGELNAALEGLPDQKARDPKSDEPPKRNDSLLVTANLSLFPKTRMTTLYLYQLVNAIRTGTLFHRYGLVRMLIWARPEDVHPTILPIAVQQRGRAAMEAELSCEWINEVAGPDIQDPSVVSSVFRSKKAGGPRDPAIELLSAYWTLRRLKEQGITIPEGRETRFAKEAAKIKGGERALEKRMLSPVSAPLYASELEELERGFEEGEFERGSVEHKRLKALRYRQTNAAKEAGSYGELLKEYDELQRMYAGAADEEKIRVAETTWNDKVSALTQHSLTNFRLLKDNVHLVRQDPPAMLWDRRTLEPLAVSPSEFYPNIPCCLLDVQPKAPNPLISSHEEGTRVFELLIKVMLRNTRVPVSARLDDVFTDTSEGILHDCPSLRDPAKGGSRIGGHGEVSVRTLNEGQWGEIVKAWLGWHFRPGVDALVRQHEEMEEEDADEEGAQGGNELSL